MSNGYINEKPAKILFYTGSDTNVISVEFCRKHSFVALAEINHEFVLPNKYDQAVELTREHVTLSIGSYSEPMRFAVLPLVRNQ